MLARRSLLVLAVPLLAALVLAACGGDAASSPPSEDPDVVGFVTDVTPATPVTEGCVEPSGPVDPDAPVSSSDPPVCTPADSGRLGTVLVEEQPGAASGGTKIVFTVTDETAVLRATSEGHVPASFDELGRGATVSAWSTGAIAESYPAQATARAIVIAEGP